MNFFSRLFKIFQSEAHSAVDNIEDPIKMSEQGIRDLRKDLGASMTSLAEVKALAIGLKKELETRKQQAGEYEQKAMLLLQKGQRGELVPAEADRLASEALSRKETLVADATRLAKDLESQEAAVAKMEAHVRRLKNQITDWENELKMLRSRAKVADSTKKLNKQIANVDSSSTIAMLERMKTRVETDEALAESYGELAQIESREAEVDKEINKALEGGVAPRVADSLAEMKAKLGIETEKPAERLIDA